MDTILKYFTEFSELQVHQLTVLQAVYNEWNANINVISRKDIESLYEKHVLHSLSVAATFDFPDQSTIVDIGTGGGFPGIPLAIFFPNVKFHLVDSIAKKLKVVDAVVNATGLLNVTTQHIRAEEIKDRKFDFAVSRAVASLKDLWRWSKPLLKSSRSAGSEAQPPGLICLKGGELAQEISDSQTRPRILEISEIFPEEYFKEKFILYVSNDR